MIEGEISSPRRQMQIPSGESPVVSLRLRMRGIVEDTYLHATTPESFVDETFERWGRVYEDLPRLDDTYDDVRDKLHNSQAFLVGDDLLRWRLTERDISPDIFLKSSVGNGLVLAAEELIGEKYNAFHYSMPEGQAHDEEILHVMLPNGIIDKLQATGKSLQTVAETEGGTVFIADDPISAEIARLSALIVCNATSMPTANTLEFAFFLSSVSLDTAYYDKMLRKSVAGVGKRGNRHGQKDANFYDFTTVLINFLHEKRHAQQENLLGLISETDAMNEELSGSADIVKAAEQGVLDGIVADIPRFVRRLEDLGNLSYKHSSYVLQKAVTPPVASQLVADHNIRINMAATKNSCVIQS